MPNRILKESICTSETIDALSAEAEAFFYRLMVQCDDFGRMDARPNVLRARCYPLRLDKVTDKQVSRWLGELASADLLWVYEVDGRPYLQVTTWDKHQQKRAKHSKYPQPPARDITCNQLQADASNSPRESRNENTRNENTRNETFGAKEPAPAPTVETLPESEMVPETKPEPPVPLSVGQREFLDAFGAKRFKLNAQREAVLALERQYGTAKLKECVTWAAKRGMNMGDAIISIEKAIPKWGQQKAVNGNGRSEGHGRRSNAAPGTSGGEAVPVSRATAIARQLTRGR